MEEYIFQLRNYLPTEYIDIENGEYIEYLVNACLTNIGAKTYQFAFIAFHMLYMSFIYKTIWLLRKERYENVEVLLNQIARDIQIVSSPFDFSVIEEAKSFQILKCLRFHQNEIEAFSLPVKNRNHCSHASGKIQYVKGDIEQFLTNELQNAEKILLKTRICLERVFTNFINDNWEPETRALISAKETVESFIRQNLLSAKELELLIPVCINELSKASDNRKNIYIKTLCLVFFAVIQKHTGNEENLLLKHLPLFINGFDKQTEVSLEILVNDEFSEILKDFDEKDKNTFTQITRPHENIEDVDRDIPKKEHLKDSVSTTPHEATLLPKNALLILTGGRVLPDILTLLYLQPQLVIVIAPQEGLSSLKILMDIVSGLPDCEARFVSDVNAYDIDRCMQVCMEACLPYPESAWNWCITTSSATKIMSLVGYELAKQRKVPCLYVDTFHEKVISLVKEMEVDTQRFFRLSISDYIKSYGFKQTLFPFDHNYRSTIEKLYDVAQELALSPETVAVISLLRDKRANIKFTLPPELKSSSLLSSLKKRGFLEIARQSNEDTITCNFNSNIIAKFIGTGDWLTIFVWHELVKARFADDCQWGCLISKGHGQYEVDIAFTYKTKLFIVDCRTSRDSFSSENISRLDSNANLLGGGSVGKIFISSQSIPQTAVWQAFCEQAALKGIVIVTKEDLPNIATILKGEMLNATYPSI